MTVAILVAIMGVGASVPLIPKDSELAFIRFKDHLYDTARGELEQRLADGDLSVSVVRSLAELYLQFADVDAAILVLERFVAEHPDDLAARRMLGTYYQFGQRPYDYLRNLEQIAARDRSETVLRELADIYSWVDEPDKQITILQGLDARGHATTVDLAALARLQAARGRYAAAVAALDRAEQISPDALDEDGLDLLASLLVDAGRGDEVVTRLARRPSVAGRGDLSARLARTVHGKGHPDLAARLLEATVASGREDEATLAALTHAEVDGGMADRALARLRQRRRDGALPEAMRATLIELAVHQGDLETAWSVGEAARWRSLPGQTLAGVLALAHARGKTDDVQRVLHDIGDGCLEGAPVLAAQLAVARGEPVAAARWIAVADRHAAIGGGEQPALADVERQIGRPDAAYARVRRHVAAGAATTWAIELLAQLALDTRATTDAAPVLDRARARHGLPADVAWARVATAAGKTDAVRAWLESPSSRQAPAQAMRDVTNLALDRGDVPLALMAARRLSSGVLSRDDQVLRARAFAAANRPEDALAVLRPLVDRDREVAAMFDAVLGQAAAGETKVRSEIVQRATTELRGAGPTPARRAELVRRLIAGGALAQALPAMEPLVRDDAATWLSPYVDAAKRSGEVEAAAAYLARRVQGGSLSPSSLEPYVRALLELGAVDAALPYLHDLAARDEAWVFAFDAALSAPRRRDARVAMWRQRGSSLDVAVGDRRAAAFKLLELRDKAGAEDVLRALASNEAPDGQSVATLLHLWGPRPSPQAIAWLEARARSANGRDRAGWLNHLTHTGAARRAVAVQVAPPPPTDVATFAAWVGALRAARDRDGLGRAITIAATTSRDAAQLLALGQIALAESLPAHAATAFEALVAIDPDALEARRWLGLLAVAHNDVVGAREHFEHYVARGGRDPEALLRYGELLERGGRLDAARRTYAMGLDASTAGRRATVAERRTHAFLLAHAGRADDARRDLESLVAEQPSDTHLRADYVAWLMKEGRHADARRVLDLR